MLGMLEELRATPFGGNRAPGPSSGAKLSIPLGLRLPFRGAGSGTPSSSWMTPPPPPKRPANPALEPLLSWTERNNLLPRPVRLSALELTGRREKSELISVVPASTAAVAPTVYCPQLSSDETDRSVNTLLLLILPELAATLLSQKALAFAWPTRAASISSPILALLTGCPGKVCTSGAQSLEKMERPTG